MMFSLAQVFNLAIAPLRQVYFWNAVNVYKDKPTPKKGKAAE